MYYGFIHNIVETFDKFFESVVSIKIFKSNFSKKIKCELDIMYNLEKAHYILEEMIQDGEIIENNKEVILSPLHALQKAS